MIGASLSGRDDYIVKELREGEAAYCRHLLAVDGSDTGRINAFLSLLMSKCASTRNIWRTFMQYAASEDEGYTIWPVLYDKKKIVGIEPSFTWRFEEGRSIEPLQEMYDERIVIELSWMFEGIQYRFKGYWYVTSIAFIEEQMKTHDPYYRRFILLMKTFNADEVTRLIQKEVDYLALLDHDERESYIFYHFEHEGQTMFYER